MNKSGKFILTAIIVIGMMTGTLDMSSVKASSGSPLSPYSSWVHTGDNCYGELLVIASHRVSEASHDRIQKCSGNQHIASCWIFKVTYNMIYDVQCTKCGITSTMAGTETVYEHRDVMAK